MDKNYNVDDILSEIKQRKQRERGQAPSSAGFPTRPTAPVPPAAGADAPAPATDTTPPPQARPAVPPRPARPARNPLEFDSENVRPLTERARSRSERPGRSQLLRNLEPKPAGTQTPPPPNAELEKTQLHFDVKSAIEQPAPPAADDTTQVISAGVSGLTSTGRELKLDEIKKLDFSGLREQGAGYYDDEEEELADGLPAGSVVDLGEYNATSNRKDVSRDIANTKLWLFIRTILTGLLSVVLLYYSLCGRYESLPMPLALFPVGDTLKNYYIFCTILTAVVALVGSSTVGGGLISLFKMRANSDTLPALAVLAAVGQGIAAIMNADQIDPTALNLYFPVAALAMFFNAFGKMSMIERIQQNFRIVSADRPKWTVQAVESDEFCQECIKDSTRRKPVIAYSARAGFFSDFLALSFSDKYDVGINRAVAPVCLGGSLIVGIITFFLTENMFSAISATTAILTISATFSSAFIENIPLQKLSKKLFPLGAMVAGNKSVEDFCETRAVILTDADLFSKKHISLHGIKAFAHGRIDDAILDAASVICAVDGALSPVFLEMIGGDKRLLKKVDNIVLEDGMGIAAWVNSRRVLIGNRALMENHGIALPTDSYERGERSDLPGYPLYLSNSGEVSARFLVDYHIDEKLAEQLDLLADKGKDLLVYTNDANIDAEMLWTLYGYPKDHITVLPARLQEEYRETSKPRDTAVAEIVHTGNATAYVASILACITARTSILTATIIHLVQIVVGYTLITFTAFMGGIGTLTIFQLLAYQLFWFVTIFILQQLRQN